MASSPPVAWFGASKHRSSFFLWIVVATALAHLCVVALYPNCLISSNVLQTVAVVLAFTLSAHRARRCTDPASRHAWAYLVCAFGLFVLAQSLYLRLALQLGRPPSFPSSSDVVWLLFPLPLLLLATTSESQETPLVANWMDISQAALFFCLLAVAVFSEPRVISVSLAYDLQSAAMLLACLLRYRNSPPGPVRTLLRSVSIYLVTYAAFSSLGNRLSQSHWVTRAWADLCWSYPPLVFCIAILLTREVATSPADDHTSSVRKPSGAMALHLQAASSLILALMSGVASAYVALSHRYLGLASLAGALTLFAIRTGAREAQLHRAFSALEHAAHQDALTKLANRNTLLDRLVAVGRRPAKPGRSAALLFLDLDRFKAINDSLGHGFGNNLLLRVSELLQQSVREDDLVVRLGGDEFAILLQATTADNAASLAQRIVERFHAPICLEGRTIHITTSIGIALASAEQTPDNLIRDADCAMYAAKKAGRNTVRAFSPSMHQSTAEALDLEMDLRHAIDSGDLLVFYQPIISVSRQRIVGFEALSRWNHPRFGPVPPIRFIPIAEETGLIIELGQQVLAEACAQIHQWNQAGQDLFISVNVSARQFADPNFFDRVVATLEATGLSPSYLKLEITESVLLDGHNAITETLERARQLGITIAMDDFGTGYSSLSYLQTLPFDTVKIDQSFTRGLSTDSKNVELVRTIIHLLHQLGKEVIAEGVETAEQRSKITGMRCDLLQGYLFSKPVPAPAAEALLLAQISRPQHEPHVAPAHRLQRRPTAGGELSLSQA